jgi:hypothetical protein
MAMAKNSEIMSSNFLVQEIYTTEVLALIYIHIVHNMYH